MKPRPIDPGAPRVLKLADQAIVYHLRRRARKTIGLAVGPQGLEISVPLAATEAAIDAALQAHAGWILKKLADRKALPSPLVLSDGVTLSLLGKTLTLRFPAGQSRIQWCDDGCTLRLPSCFAATALERALRLLARRVLPERLSVLAAQLGVGVPPMTLSSARTRWGSCNSRGEIRLNWRLVFFPLPLVDYVVAHELAHLKEMNHSPRFWSVVERLCPDYRALRSELKAAASRLPVFQPDD